MIVYVLDDMQLETGRQKNKKPSGGGVGEEKSESWYLLIWPVRELNWASREAAELGIQSPLLDLKPGNSHCSKAPFTFFSFSRRSILRNPNWVLCDDLER